MGEIEWDTAFAEWWDTLVKGKRPEKWKPLFFTAWLRATERERERCAVLCDEWQGVFKVGNAKIAARVLANSIREAE